VKQQPLSSGLGSPAPCRAPRPGLFFRAAPGYAADFMRLRSGLSAKRLMASRAEVAGTVRNPCHGPVPRPRLNVLAAVAIVGAVLGSGGPAVPVSRPMGERVLAVTNAASAHPCDADLEADMEYVDRIDITLAVFCAPPSPGAVNSATMFATMKQALTSLGPVPFDAYGDGGDVYKLDPCSLPGGSDLPGAVLTYGVVISKPVPTKYFKSFHLPDDTTPPVLSMTPPTGTLVHPGQVIEVHVTATDATDQGPKFGIQYIQLLKDPSGLIGSKDYGNHSTACDTSRLTKTFTTTYTVPDNPGPVITLTARCQSSSLPPASNGRARSARSRLAATSRSTRGRTAVTTPGTARSPSSSCPTKRSLGRAR